MAENGPELINLPKGAQVTPASQTRMLLTSGNDNRASTAPVIVNDFRGALVTEDVYARASAIAAQHASAAEERAVSRAGAAVPGHFRDALERTQGRILRT